MSAAFVLPNLFDVDERKKWKKEMKERKKLTKKLFFNSKKQDAISNEKFQIYLKQEQSKGYPS